MSMQLYLEQWNGWETPGIAPYVRTMSDKELHVQGFEKLKAGAWTEISFVIPDTDGDLIDEAGIILEGYSVSKAKTLGVIYLDEFSITGDSAYTISLAKQRKEFGTVTPFSTDHGAWEIEDGRLSLMRCGEAFAYAGNYYAADCRITTDVEPVNGEDHLLLLRAQGAMRGYALGFAGPGKAAIYKNDFGFTKLAETDYPWEAGRNYHFSAAAEGNRISLLIDDREVLCVEDGQYAYGMFGCGSLSMGRTFFGDFTVRATQPGRL